MELWGEFHLQSSCGENFTCKVPAGKITSGSFFRGDFLYAKNPFGKVPVGKYSDGKSPSTHIRPDPPPRTFISNIIPKNPVDISYYELLLNKLEFNNNDFVQKLLSKSSIGPPSPPNRHRLEPIFESQESDAEVL